jgi:hypothetical protein
MAQPTKEQILEFLNSQFTNANTEGIIDLITMKKWSRNEIFDLNDIESNSNIQWDKTYVALNETIPIQSLLDTNNDDYLTTMGGRSDMTIAILLENSDRNWNWLYISRNTELSISDLVTNFPDKINWRDIIERNDFNQDDFTTYASQIPLSVLIQKPQFFNTP